MRAWLAFGLVGLIGCSSSSPPADGGATDSSMEAGDSGIADTGADVKVPARGAVMATFSPADAGCSGTIFSAGMLPNGLVDDGPTTSVVCSVHPMGQTFMATITINASGTPSGIDLVGSLTASGTQMMDVLVRDMMGMPIMKMMCTGTYPMNGGVSAGKLWIQLACMPSMDPPPSNCPVTVEVRVENCKI